MIATNHQYRIDYQILVDCYDELEAGMGWTAYLLDNMQCPFEASYTGKSKVLSIAPEQTMTVLSLVNSEYDGDEDYEYFMAQVEVEIGDALYEVPLENIKVTSGTLATQQAVADWQYFINLSWEDAVV